ncbi:polysaccharide deacetylase family protein [Streptomyces yaizuensis]|uniref:Polysaccharide deacetylase family protein n=1 Tax=Streptomyces yaizuensis TaxID=2989713 RepID=A0ABQ5P5I8_9ACTN|nr:polysaccharide deacetylase family protein [Streptomyces sp. YSPA8]
MAALSAVALVGCGQQNASDQPRKGASDPVAANGPNAIKPPAVTPVYRRAPVPDESDEESEETEETEPLVALTFDADMTADQGRRAMSGERFDNPDLVQTLRTLKVPATIFMTGRWAEEYPDQAKEIGTDPLFEIGNHSYSHYGFTANCHDLPTVSKGRMLADVKRADAAIRRTGARNIVPYFRFPGGCFDKTSLKAIAPAGKTAVQWDVVSGDAFANYADAVVEQVMEDVTPGSVVVLHLTRSAAPVTEAAIEQIVPELRDQGYRLVKVSDLMKAAKKK